VTTEAPNYWYLSGNNAWHEVAGVVSSTVGRVDILVGDTWARTFVSVHANESCSVNSPVSATGFIASGIGIDSSTATSSQTNPIAYTSAAIPVAAYSFYDGYPDAGRHTLRWLEAGSSGISFYCYGSTSSPSFGKSSMSGYVVM
jgi:hypothetical protein